MSNEVVFMVTSGYGARTSEPYVQIVVKAWDALTQMSPDSARELAANLLQAAEAAETDGFLVTFVSGRVGLGMKETTQVLVEFREWREQRRNGGRDERKPASNG